ncbi:hypothetical protein, partial [uncultured Desulfovibrio sp.]|uniref:hypothetical protein n=1 Tax=uncultured Desulfovibrio sp. TaxID=167968 RepID=UPI00262C4A4E
AVFPARFGPGGAVLPPRVSPFSKVKRSMAPYAKFSSYVHVTARRCAARDSPGATGAARRPRAAKRHASFPQKPNVVLFFSADTSMLHKLMKTSCNRGFPGRAPVLFNRGNNYGQQKQFPYLSV